VLSRLEAGGFGMYETMFESKMDNYLVETYEQAVRRLIGRLERF